MFKLPSFIHTCLITQTRLNKGDSNVRQPLVYPSSVNMTMQILSASSFPLGHLVLWSRIICCLFSVSSWYQSDNNCINNVIIDNCPLSISQPSPWSQVIIHSTWRQGCRYFSSSSSPVSGHRRLCWRQRLRRESYSASQTAPDLPMQHWLPGWELMTVSWWRDPH